MNESEPRERIGVITALRAERHTAAGLSRAGWRVLCSGVGPTRAAAAARKLVAEGVSRLLVWGTAGGLDAGLVPGALVIPSRVIAAEGGVFDVDAAWRTALVRRLAPTLDIQDGALVTVARPVAEAAQKRALAARTGAVAVDMETAAVAAVARAQGLPCVVVRAVADPLELPLPSVVMAAAGGRLLAAEIALRLLMRPRDVPGTLRLQRAFRLACNTLVRASQRLSDANGPWESASV